MKLIIFFILFSLNSFAQNQIEFKNDLEILDSNISFGGESEYKMLSIIGNINNKSDNNYKNLVIEVKLFDADHNLIDTLTSELYANIFPANDSAAFKMEGGSTSKTQTGYTSHEIRILSADIKKTCKSKSGIQKFLSEWGGFIVFILFMAFFIYSGVKYQKEEKQTKQKFMDAADSQSKQFDKMTQLLENIAQNKEK